MQQDEVGSNLLLSKKKISEDLISTESLVEAEWVLARQKTDACVFLVLNSHTLWRVCN